MGNLVPVCDINAALVRIKTAVAAGRYQFVERRKNLLSLAAAGLLPKHVVSYILSLTYMRYLSGPEPERDARFPQGEVYLFGCFVDEDEFFIKLKLFQQGDGEWCTCMSFHIAEGKLHYPYGRR